MKLYLCALLLTGTAFAGETVTTKPATYELRNELSKPISKGYATLAECQKAAPVPAIDWRCVETSVFTKVGFCDAAVPPAPVVVDGFMLQGTYVGHECPTGDHLYFTQTQPVREPYPSCAWVDKPVQVTDCDGRIINPPFYPNSGTEQTDQTKGPWIEGVDYPMNTPCPEAAHGNCYLSPRAPTPAP